MEPLDPKNLRIRLPPASADIISGRLRSRGLLEEQDVEHFDAFYNSLQSESA